MWPRLAPTWYVSAVARTIFDNLVVVIGILNVSCVWRCQMRFGVFDMRLKRAFEYRYFWVKFRVNAKLDSSIPQVAHLKSDSPKAATAGRATMTRALNLSGQATKGTWGMSWR